MSKDTFNRDSFRSSMLKSVIIRIDFSDISNLEGAISTLNSILTSNFASNKVQNSKNINFSLAKEDMDGGVISLPVDTVQKIYTYSRCKIQPEQNVRLDISNKYVCLVIQCDENYYKLDDYIDLVSQIMDGIQSYDGFVQLGRIGIRKVDGEDFPNVQSARNVFENITDIEQYEGEMFVPQRNITSLFVDKGTGMQVNQTISAIYLKNGQFRVVLDMDAYWNQVEENSENLSSKVFLQKKLCQLNEKLFVLFKENVTESFLTEGSIN